MTEGFPELIITVGALIYALLAINDAANARRKTPKHFHIHVDHKAMYLCARLIKDLIKHGKSDLLKEDQGKDHNDEVVVNFTPGGKKEDKDDRTQ